jgi:hypothetical protein
MLSTSLLYTEIGCFFAEYCRYDEAPIGQKPYRQKDGALLAVGALCDKLKQTEPYKLQLEHMLVQHVYPEFKSPVGHLRAKVRISDYTTMMGYSLNTAAFSFTFPNRAAQLL